LIGELVASPWTVWGIVAAATAGVIARPFSWPEFIWAVSGAVLLVLLGLLPFKDALAGIFKGTDVYLFLVGMMLLAELARQEGLFDWLAACAARLAKGSATRLFTLVFVVGTIVTTFLSNDATAVVLTPAVAAVVKTAKAREALPFLFICAFVANAASFVLPISNPANLVIYGSHMPPTQRGKLQQDVSADIEVPDLSEGGTTAGVGIVGTAVVLLVSSAFDIQLGLPTFIAGVATAFLVLVRTRSGPMAVIKNISWGVLPLVAGLFVLVQALQKTGVTNDIANLLHHLVQSSASLAAWVSGIGLAVVCNLANNLPVGLVAGRVVQIAKVPEHVRSAVLIGVDLGPNLSVTGSLATILWLTALRREGQTVDAWTFLKLGTIMMPTALVLSLAAAFLF
jgi:arsenical pump membrane protein